MVSIRLEPELRERSRYIRSLGAHGSEAHIRPFPGCRSTWRNEPNFGRKWLSYQGGLRFKKGRVRVLPSRFGCCGGLEVLEGFEGAEEHAVCGIDSPLNASKGLESVLVGVTDWGIVLDRGVEKFFPSEVFVEAFDLVIPELGFDATETALDPFCGDERVDERELDGIGRLVVEEELFGEGFELGWIFAGDDVGPGVDAGFEGVQCGSSFAFGCYWAGRFLSVESICVNLRFCRHDRTSKG